MHMHMHMHMHLQMLMPLQVRNQAYQDLIYIKIFESHLNASIEFVNSMYHSFIWAFDLTSYSTRFSP
ncbi:Uncharacterised protein [Paenibacillus macerans]|nr:Uncharacterised protein [Paenibacillus macerans]